MLKTARLLCLILLMGCSSSDGGNSSGGTTPDANVTGTWVGTATSALAGGFLNITLTLQSGSNVTGTFACSAGSISCLHTTGTLSGTISGNNLTAILSYPDGHGCGAFDGTVSGNSLSGDYACSDPVVNDFGTWTVARQ